MMEDPYRGLMPYQESDAEYFFGRDRERKVIASNLSAARFTVLYGPSGVGKTSALRAGVMRDLRLEAQRNQDELGLPEFAVAWLSTWRGDPVAALDKAVREAVAIAMSGDGGPVKGTTPIEKLACWNERLNGEIFLILDQFEEYFLYHPNDTPDSFGALLPKIVTNHGLKVNILLSLRDDALSQLDRFKGRIPDLFSNYLRIDRLTREAGQLAIEQPVMRWNQTREADTPEVIVEPALTSAVLDEVRTGQQGFGERGLGRAVTDGQRDEEIETPFLQLVMQRIWSEERQENSNALRLETLERLGGASEILRTHLGRVLAMLPSDEREIARKIFYYLVTPSGAKIAHSAADLASYADCDEEIIEIVVQRLCERQSRILREVAASDETARNRYEIYHDVLGNAILEWQRNSKAVEEKERILEQQARAAAQKNLLIRKTARLNMWILSMGAVLLIGFYMLRSYQLEEARQTTQLKLEVLQSDVASRQQAVLYPLPPPNTKRRTGAFSGIFSTLSRETFQAQAPAPVNLTVMWELESALREEIEYGLITIHSEQSNAHIRLSSVDLFDPGAPTLNPAYLNTIETVAKTLRGATGRILIVGHTDNEPLTRSSRYTSNQQLSQARAETVADVIKELVVDPSRVFSEGRGDSEPIAANKTSEGRAANRRIEILLLGGY